MKHIHLELAADARSAGSARHSLRTLLDEAAANTWTDSVVLAASEVITNAVMHAGTAVSLEAWATADGVRVEVRDGSSHLPTRRKYALTSGTGRGLHILDHSVERWGAEPLPTGKAVWFELGQPPITRSWSSSGSLSSLPSEPDATVRLLDVPLLMHWAWQEHAQTLLREYLLFALEWDPAAIDRHAQASDALSTLYDQIPVPRLPDDPDQLLADAIEPAVTAEQFTITVPRASVPHFATLDSLLTSACEAASRGDFLGLPTQPEISEMRQWICREVARQAEDDAAAPDPWRPRTDVRTPLVDESVLKSRYQEFSDSDEAVLVTDQTSVIVAVTPPVLRFLGYDSEADLLGRRVIVVIPHRFHQAHIAGTTLNSANGRRPLLDTPLEVPVLRADGSEAPVGLRVSSHHLQGEDRVFVATFSFTY